MNINKYKTDLEISNKGAEYIIQCIKQNPKALICIATGNSPKEMYRIVAGKIVAENIDVNEVRLIALDEWYRLPNEHPATCRAYIQKYVSKPWGIAQKNIILFNANTDNPVAECNNIADKLKMVGPIDLCILGVGRNGHLGLNEPGVKKETTVHVATLQKSSQQHGMLTASNITVTQGMTLGIKEILQSEKILLLITGNHKKEAFKAFQTKADPIQWSVNYLWDHKNVTCIVNRSSVE